MAGCALFDTVDKWVLGGCSRAVHAHIVLWVHEDDLEEAGRGISGAVPGVFVPNEGNGYWVAPEDASEVDKRLLKLVLAHQQHKCYSQCCQKGFCKYGFPYDPQEERSPTWDDAKGRYTYYRPGLEHRNISPYHPAILLAWGAHCNLVRVANCAWSLYLLKYAMKANLVDDITTDKEVAKRLGLHNTSDEMLHLLSTLVFAKPVSPCEAAIIMAGIPIFYTSDPVEFVASQPPKLRARYVNRKQTTFMLAPVDKYCARRKKFEHLTFMEYFTKYMVTTVRAWRGCCVW